MRKGRLLKVARYLETTVVRLEAAATKKGIGRRFSIWSWGHTESGCGFAGCGVGWAAHSKLIPGLAYTEGCGAEPTYTENGRTHEGWAAVRRAFGIKGNQAEHLFMGSRYRNVYGVTYSPSAPEVAARIRELVRS